jgi:hypothetical protein
MIIRSVQRNERTNETVRKPVESPVRTALITRATIYIPSAFPENKLERLTVKGYIINIKYLERSRRGRRQSGVLFHGVSFAGSKT